MPFVLATRIGHSVSPNAPLALQLNSSPPALLEFRSKKWLKLVRKISSPFKLTNRTAPHCSHHSRLSTALQRFSVCTTLTQRFKMKFAKYLFTNNRTYTVWKMSDDEIAHWEIHHWFSLTPADTESAALHQPALLDDACTKKNSLKSYYSKTKKMFIKIREYYRRSSIIG